LSFYPGLGADKSSDDNWLSHQLAFDDLLSKLNDNIENGSEEGSPKKKGKRKHEMEKTARQSRKRVFYNRFIQSKDLSSKSAEDMACVFGQRSKSVPGTPQEQSEGEESDTSTASCPPPALHGVQIINSGQSIQEYFEKKMREMKAARERKGTGGENTINEEVSPIAVQGEGSQNQEMVEEGSILRKKKKEKKRKRKIVTETGELRSNESGLEFGEDECSVKKKKKKDTVSDGETELEVHVTRSEERKKKKRKEKNFKVVESEICKDDGVQRETIGECLIAEETKTDKKKGKSNKKDKNASAVEVEMSSTSNERKEKKNKLKKSRESDEEEMCGQSVIETKDTKNDKRKKRKREGKNSVSCDADAVEITIKEDKGKKEKKNDKIKSSEKKRKL